MAETSIKRRAGSSKLLVVPVNLSIRTATDYCSLEPEYLLIIIPESIVILLRNALNIFIIICCSEGKYVRIERDFAT